MGTPLTPNEISLQNQNEIDYHEEEHQAKIGNCIAQLFLLKRTGTGLYNTSWGVKSDLGLYLSVKKIIDEERINI